jgi:NADH:ubiquinone oxidoreductase subunit H
VLILLPILIGYFTEYAGAHSLDIADQIKIVGELSLLCISSCLVSTLFFFGCVQNSTPTRMCREREKSSNNSIFLDYFLLAGESIYWLLNIYMILIEKEPL